MSSAKDRFRRMRDGSFRSETIDKLQSWIVFVGVPLMVLLVAILMVVVSQWITDARLREEIRVERLNNAVERVIDEVRDPQSRQGHTREETFDRIYQLCAAEPECDP